MSDSALGEELAVDDGLFCFDDALLAEYVAEASSSIVEIFILVKESV